MGIESVSRNSNHEDLLQSKMRSIADEEVHPFEVEINLLKAEKPRVA